MDSIQDLLSNLRSRLTKIESGNIRDTHELFFKDSPRFLYDLKISLALPENQEAKNVVRDEISLLITQIRGQGIRLLQEIRSFTRYRFPDGRVLEIIEKGSVSEFDLEIKQDEFPVKDEDRKNWFTEIEKEISSYESLFKVLPNEIKKNKRHSAAVEVDKNFESGKLTIELIEEIYKFKVTHEGSTLKLLIDNENTRKNFERIMRSGDLKKEESENVYITLACSTKAAVEILSGLKPIIPNIDNWQMIEKYKIIRTKPSNKKSSTALTASNASSSQTHNQIAPNKFSAKIKERIHLIIKNVKS